MKILKIYFIIAVIFINLWVFACSISAATYYVDNAIVDANIVSETSDCVNYNPSTFTCGNGSASAFATVADVNSFTFLQPGDQVLFRKGQVFREKLTIPTSGTSGNLITFGAFGSGANPKFNGSSLIDNANFSPYTVTNTIFSITPTTNQADGATRNYRQYLTVSSNSSHVKIRLTASDSADWVIAGVSIGPQSSGAAASSLTRVTWDDGSNGTTITHGTYKDSDLITFSVTTGQTYLIHIYMTARNMKYASATGHGYYYDSIASDETLVVSPTGSQLVGIANNVSIVTAVFGDDEVIWSTTTLPSYSISSITSSGVVATVATTTAHHLTSGQYVTIGGASPAGYNVTNAIIYNVTETGFRYTVPAGLSSPATGTITYTINHPIAVWENNVFLAKQASITNVAAGAGRWYYDTGTGTLYVNGLSQDDPTTNGKTYEAAHLAYSIWDNQKNYIEVKNIDCLETVGLPGSDGVIGGNGMSGIYLQGNNNIVHDLEVYNTGRHGFSFYTGSVDNLGYNLTIHDDINTTVVTIYGTGTTNNTLRDSAIYQSQAATSSNSTLVFHGTSSENIVENNDFNSNGSTGIIVIYDTGTNGNIVRYNNFRGIFTRAIYVYNGGTGSPENNTIYGNLFNGLGGTSDLILLSGSRENSIYNNTIISPSSATTGAAINLVSSQDNIIKNNIFYGPWTIRVSDATSEVGFISDYNLFYGTSGTKWTWGGTDYTTFSDWKTNSFQDSHSLDSDPKFINFTSDFSLQSTSPCINAGTDVGLTTDYAGISIPQGSGVDMGAYEYRHYTLAYVAESHGSISGSSSQSVLSGGSGTSVTAIPDTGYKFLNWSDGSVSATRLDVNVSQNSSYTANFIPSGGGGSALLLKNLQSQQQSKQQPPSLSFQIQSLLDQIKSLEQQIFLINSFNASTDSKLKIMSTLKYGSNGEEVIILQNKLKKLGFFPITTESNGHFGPATLKAVQNFQTDNNITKPHIYGYGMVGPKTREVINRY